MTALDDLCQIPFHDAPAPLRARILSQLADTPLFVTLEREPADDAVQIRLVDGGEYRLAVASDSDERLAAFWQGPVAYAAIPGRVLASLLSANNAALLVNPGTVSEMLLDAESLAWLGESLESRPEATSAVMLPTLSAPAADVASALHDPLQQRLRGMFGLVESAALVGASWPDRAGHLLLMRGTAASRHDVVAKAMGELLAFLPEIEGGVDIAFADPLLPDGAMIVKVPEPLPPEPETVQRDPNAPPRLKW